MSILGQSILSVDQFDRDAIQDLFRIARLLEPVAQRRQRTDILSGAVLANLFFEASTRTRLSFCAAFQRLGGSVSDTTGFTFSSISKGESLYDSSRVIAGYADVIALRHPEEGSVKTFAERINIPVINAGDGIGEHPTQSLLDLYTIDKEFSRIGKTIDNSTVLIFGDLKHGRTVHSLVKLLVKYRSMKFVLVAPSELALPSDLQTLIVEQGHQLEICTHFKSAMKDVDVVYATRLQKERLSADFKTNYGEEMTINKALVDKTFTSDVVIMHPLPRDSAQTAFDLSTDLNTDPRLAIFRQADNGIPVRMALFTMILGVADNIAGSLKDVQWHSPRKTGKDDAEFPVG